MATHWSQIIPPSASLRGGEGVTQLGGHYARLLLDHLRGNDAAVRYDVGQAELRAVHLPLG